MITLNSTSAVASAVTDIWTTNTAAATDTGTLTWSILNTAANTHLAYCYATNLSPALGIAGGQAWVFGLTVRCPTGPSVALALQVQALDSTGAQLSSWVSPATVVGATATSIFLTAGTLPAGTTQLRLLAMLAEGTGASRTLAISSINARIAALPDELLSVSVSRDMARGDYTGGDGALILAQGPVGPRTGTLVFLVSTWDQVTQLDGLYRNGLVSFGAAMPPVLPASYAHYAVDKVRSATEKALPGRAPRWLVTVQIREAI